MKEPEHICEVVLPNGEALEVWRLPHGGIVGIDASFLDAVQDTIADPYNSFNGEDNQYQLPEVSDCPVYDLTKLKDVVE